MKVLLKVSVEQLLEVLTEDGLKVWLHFAPGYDVEESAVETVSEM